MRASRDPAARPAANSRTAPERLLDLIQIASLVLDRERRVVAWTPAAEQLTGYPAADVLGTDVSLIIEPAARERAAHLFSRVARGSGWVGFVPFLRAGGGVLDTAVQAVALRFPAEGDADPAHRGRDLVQLLIADAAALRRVSFERTLFESLFNQIPVGISIYDPDRRFLRVNAAVARYDQVPADEHVGRRIEEVLPEIDPAITQLQRQVLASGKPVVDRIVRITPRRHGPAAADGATTPAATAAKNAAATAGSDRFLSASCARLESAEGRILGMTAITVDVTERQRAAQRNRAARRRAAVINAANSRIGISLEFGRTAAELAHVAVPLFADAARVFLVQTPDGASPHAQAQSAEAPEPLSLVPIATRHRKGRKRLRPPQAGRDELPPILPGTDLYAALLAGRARFIHFAQDQLEAPPSLVPAASSIAATNALTRASATARGDATEIVAPPAPGQGGMASLGQSGAQARADLGEQHIAAPMVARGTLLGVACFSRDPGREAFLSDDLDTAEELAARAAVGLDNARLYARERAAALMLQRTLLQEQIPRVEGLRLAFRYRPGSADAEVGGDWLDVFALPGCRVAFVVGDVMGSGLRAAGIMGQFRTAARTLSQLDLGPAAVLRELDRLAASMSDAHIATCVYAVYDPIAGRCVLSAAGHLPPIIIGPNGGARTVDLPPGAPLGVGAVRFEEREIALEPDCGLVLYTDGLVEDRYRDIDAGIEELVAVVGKAEPAADPAWPETACDTAFDTLLDPSRSDDATLLIAALGRFPADDVAAWVLTGQPTVAARARDLVRRQVEKWAANAPRARAAALTAAVDVAQLLVSELVTNAARYGRGPIGLRLLHAPAALVCEVSDGLEAAPRLRSVHHAEEGGRGLYLVDQLSSRWGSRAVAHGKTVWFELALPE